MNRRQIVLLATLLSAAGGMLILATRLDNHDSQEESTHNVHRKSDSSRLDTVSEDWEGWTAAYEGASLEQIRDEIESLRKYMLEQTRAYYEEQYQAGNFERVNERRVDGSYPLEIGDDLCQWRFIPSDGLTRVVLPREGFEEVYEAKARMSWLMSREEEVEAFATLLANEQ